MYSSFMSSIDKRSESIDKIVNYRKIEVLGIKYGGLKGFPMTT